MLLQGPLAQGRGFRPKRAFDGTNLAFKFFFVAHRDGTSAGLSSDATYPTMGWELVATMSEFQRRTTRRSWAAEERPLVRTPAVT